MSARFKMLSLCTAAAFAAPLALAAQDGRDLAVTMRVSTLGFGGEVSKLVAGHLGVRAGGNFFNYDRSQDMSDVSYDASLRLRNYSVLADLFLFDRGSFHVTGGVVGQSSAIDAAGRPSSTGSYSMNGTDYQSAQVGVLTGRVEFPKTAGYAGLGWGSPVRRGSRVRMVLDFGTVIGTPTVALKATGAASDPQLAADLEAQRKKTQKDVDQYAKFWPVVSTGLSVHF